MGHDNMRKKNVYLYVELGHHAVTVQKKKKKKKCGNKKKKKKKYCGNKKKKKKKKGSLDPAYNI